MKTETVLWAFEQRFARVPRTGDLDNLEQSWGPKLALVVMAVYADAANQVVLSNTELARLMGVSERSARSYVARLTRSQRVTRMTQGGGKFRGTYHLSAFPATSERTFPFELVADLAALDIDPRDKLYLLARATFANRHSYASRPGRETLMALTGLSPTSLYRAARRLTGQELDAQGAPTSPAYLVRVLGGKAANYRFDRDVLAAAPTVAAPRRPVPATGANEKSDPGKCETEPWQMRPLGVANESLQITRTNNEITGDEHESDQDGETAERRAIILDIRHLLNRNASAFSSWASVTIPVKHAATACTTANNARMGGRRYPRRGARRYPTGPGPDQLAFDALDGRLAPDTAKSDSADVTDAADVISEPTDVQGDQ